MKKRTLAIFIPIIFLLYCSSCNNRSSAHIEDANIDSTTIAKGGILFNQHCGGCHNFRQDGIGPNLAGITTLVTGDWIQHFVRNPRKMIESNDQRAQELSKRYKVVMPSFANLEEEEINSIIAFLTTHQKSDHIPVNSDSSKFSNPIPAAIGLSNLQINLELVTQIPASGKRGESPMARIIKLDFERHSHNLFVLDHRGKLYKLQNHAATVYMDIAKLRPKFIPEPRVATGAGSFSFHPDFMKNGLLYTTHTESAGAGKADFSYPDSIKVALQWVVTEWKTNNPAAATFSGTGRELLRVNMVTGMHGVQEIAFNPYAKAGDKDYGLLYICIGDGASAEEGYPFLAHNKEKVWGTVLRIDPAGSNSANGKYGIPKINPFALNQDKKILGEIYAYGFRNPHRISWSKTGDILVGNIGQGNIESIDLVKPGQDFGWPTREGNFSLDPSGDLNKLYPLPANDSIYKITYPVANYDHDEGIAISGGFEYSGVAIPALKGKYLFGDIPSGRLFYINMGEIKQGTKALIKEWKIAINDSATTLLKACGSDRVDLHFGKDAEGELYILTKADGKVYKLKSAKVY